ncbi:hypothetical protein PIROE2DRAFT_18775 [Piromyces sp. E2]|nr:hypothetical protein PIROE2DRAFT_18775 [Piromyces sp. E2]|eukprot:OUM56566.1 hypothetical protein PIROE2DRAFT_18775 [Piromyces sp. E2]
MQEKVIFDSKDFQKLTLDDAKKLKSVIFQGMEIDEEFVDKFWELFSDRVNDLSFKGCHTSKGYSFSDLFDSLYHDAGRVLSLTSPYVIRTIDFSGNKFNNRDVLFH